jgi:chloramphenicol 3-O-phosphotransferase
MGKKSKMSEEKDVKKGENVMEVCASTTCMAPSALLAQYGMAVVKTLRNGGDESSEPKSSGCLVRDEQRLMPLLSNVVANKDELRIIGILWIEATFPQTSRRGGMSGVRDVLHAAFGHEEAFFNIRTIERMLNRGILRFVDGTDFFGHTEDESDKPFLCRTLELSAGFINHVTAMDSEYAAQAQSEPEQLPSLLNFTATQPKVEKNPKTKLLTRVDSGITLKDHFLEPTLAEQIYRATRADGESIREKMLRMGVHSGPVKSDEKSSNTQSNVILLYGPPGTGKTSAAFAIAGELNVPLYTLNVDSIMSPFVGLAERNMRAAFVEYRELAKSFDISPVMLMDECDSLMRRRAAGEQNAGDRAMTNVVNVALQEIASFRGTLVMTTNSIDAIDEAFARRIRTSIKIDYPPKDIQAKIWRHYLTISMPGADTINVDALLAEATLTGALIVKCVDETVERLLLRDGDSAVLTTEDLLLSVRRQLGSFDRTLADKNADKCIPFGFV